MTDWVSVKDRLPQAKETVLAYEAAFDSMSMAYRLPNTEEWIDTGDYYALDAVTHWMPLPKPPKRQAMSKTDAPTLDENNNYIDSTTGKMMHVLTVDEMPTKQELMLGVQDESQTKKLPSARIRHLAEILENEYSDRTVTIGTLIYMLNRLAYIIAEDEPTKEEP